MDSAGFIAKTGLDRLKKSAQGESLSVQIPALSRSGCVALLKLENFSVPRLANGDLESMHF